MNKEQFEQLHTVMLTMIGKETSRHPPENISLLFRLNNLIFAAEYSQSCGGCRQRVYNRMKEYYLSNKEKFGYI